MGPYLCSQASQAALPWNRHLLCCLESPLLPPHPGKTHRIPSAQLQARALGESYLLPVSRQSRGSLLCSGTCCTHSFLHSPSVVCLCSVLHGAESPIQFIPPSSGVRGLPGTLWGRREVGKDKSGLDRKEGSQAALLRGMDTRDK